MKAWIFQRSEQVARFGADTAPWYVGWLDPAGKRCNESCGPGKAGLKVAKRLQEKRHAELLTGSYQAVDKTTWATFRIEYQKKVLDLMDVRNRMETAHALDQFEKIIKPRRMESITSETIDDYSVARQAMRG